MTIFYTVTSNEGEYPRSGLTLAQAADEILSSDSREWKIEFNDETWAIWSRQQVANIGWSKTHISSCAETLAEAEAEIFKEVIDKSWNWKGYDIAIEEKA